LAFCLANQECKKNLMKKMIYSEIYKILFFEKTKNNYKNIIISTQNNLIIVTP